MARFSKRVMNLTPEDTTVSYLSNVHGPNSLEWDIQPDEGGRTWTFDLTKFSTGTEHIGARPNLERFSISLDHSRTM